MRAPSRKKLRCACGAGKSLKSCTRIFGMFFRRWAKTLSLLGFIDFYGLNLEMRKNLTVSFSRVGKDGRIKEKVFNHGCRHGGTDGHGAADVATKVKSVK